MTVQEFLKAYFSTGSKFQRIVVKRNDGTGTLRTLYASNEGYQEQYMKPEVRNAVIRKWGLGIKPNHIWISVE